MIALVPSLELSIPDEGEAVGRDMVLTPSLSVGGFGVHVWGVASTGRSLTMSPELSFRVVREAAVGARLASESAAGGVEIRARRDEATSMRLPSRLSAGAAYGVASQISSPVLQRIRVKVSEFGPRSAAAAQVPFEGDAF